MPFSHDDLGRVLHRFVDEEGLVNYRGLAQDREDLDRYLATVEEVGPESRPELFLSRDHQLAYYLNAYNAQVLAGVLEKGPDISSAWGWSQSGAGFFVGRKIRVDGKTLNLKKLEDQEVRERFQDPRVHAALNCASGGCPRLPREPFEAERLDAQLGAAMKEFVLTERACSVEEASRTVRLSKIFSWFEEDFLDYETKQGNTEPRLLDYLNRYRPQQAQIPRDFSVRFQPYDKSLNQQP